MKAKVAEVFKSIQGEGKYVGCLQTFIRFYGCNLRCGYCDTPLTEYVVYTLHELVRQVCSLKAPVVSLTGGEPLLQAVFLREFIPLIKEKFFRIFLETNGTLYLQLKKIIAWVDIISFDIKLKSSTGRKSLWFAHEKFFDIAREKEVFFKAVITSHTEFRDIARTACFMEDKNNCTLYLQPEAKCRGKEFLKKIFYYQEYLLDENVDARILPQTHKMLGVR